MKDDQPANSANEPRPCYVHKFRTPFEWQGKEYKTLNFYFERLEGNDMVAIEREMSAQGDVALETSLSRIYQSKVAARAAGVGSDMLLKLPAREFNRICSEAQRFLLG